ncbi:FAD-binding oxidoreductase [Streptomyces ipomoeae]|uniref:FAD-binding oxidoreductase n=1 Tax=Streptomyces ipomoeae TaxID=103232 RepID=UPI0029A93D82|nr:FAD-binding oxidoreductase [Streptomyces ipomoeae]MDX2699523.1 FAD-binding oxidoreductase [Streptomyces ipomoeae]MDX2845175.1 FAD-binding oxidoreductase [Streptomyces ipomoeae]MDX2879574.1 FAD-binding oxidoreductase [Streptomyces ipomoeae]
MPTHDDFAPGFRGAVLRSGDDGFDAARVVFNGRTADTPPALIARCVDEDDVATAMRYASARDLPVAVRGGGHGADGHAMPGGALVLDLSGMREITVDPQTRTVRAQAGVVLGELDAATQEHGLVVPSGTVTTTGIAGLTLGGGVGHLMRRFGATFDHLLACEMITVDGRKVRADEKENPDLFWALRGGGGNFGVVTTFEYRAHVLGPGVVSGQIVLPGEQAAAVLSELHAFMADAPRELGLGTTLTLAPPLPRLPEEMHGKPILILIPCYTGLLRDAEEIIGRLSTLGAPVINTVGPTTWLKTNSMLDAFVPYGQRTLSRGGYLATLSEPVVDTLVERLAAMPNALGTMTTINVWSLGGALSDDVDEDATVFSRTGASWLWEAASVWTEREHDAPFDEWADATASALRPYTLPNAYTNLTEDQGEAWRRGVFGSEAKYRRLAEIKAVWDPWNLLRHNKNIAPATID